MSESLNANHLTEDSITQSFLGMSSSCGLVHDTASGYEVFSGRGFFVATADAVHHRPSGLSPDKGRFKRNRMNGLDVDGDDAKFVD